MNQGPVRNLFHAKRALLSVSGITARRDSTWTTTTLLRPVQAVENVGVEVLATAQILLTLVLRQHVFVTCGVPLLQGDAVWDVDRWYHVTLTTAKFRCFSQRSLFLETVTDACVLGGEAQRVIHNTTLSVVLASFTFLFFIKSLELRLVYSCLLELLMKSLASNFEFDVLLLKLSISFG